MNKKVSLSSSEKISLIGNLATMLGSGISIIEAVNSLLEDSKGSPKKILEALRTDLMQGKRIYVSLSNFPNAFDSVTVNLIRASEEAGTLETTLVDLRKHIEEEAEFADKIKLALVYPALIGSIFALVLMVILIFVVPKITSVFKVLKVPLPLPTRIMMFASDLIVKHTIPLVIGIALLIALLMYIFKRYHAQVLNLFFKLPMIKTLVKQIDLTRFSRSLHLLLSSGVPIATALQLTQNVVLRKQTAAVIARSRAMIMEGKRFTEGFKNSNGVIPTIMIKLIDAGEKSGTLDKSMQEISVYLDYQVTRTLKAITTMIEPIMLVVVGVAVALMMFAIIGPIYSMIGQVGAK